MSRRYIRHIKAEGVLGRFDIDQEFRDGVNVLYGRNGTGKTTLLHIIANLLNADYKRFAYPEFRTIKVWLDDGTNIVVSKRGLETDRSIKDSSINVSFNGKTFEIPSVKEVKKQDRERQDIVLRWGGPRERLERRLMRDEKDIDPILPVAYFPAFRTMIEAWASAESRSRFSNELQLLNTSFARELFGFFVPSLNYPSPTEIERQLRQEIDEAVVKVARADRESFGELLPSIFQVLSKNPILSQNSSFEEEREEGGSEVILEEIKSLIEKLEDSPLKASPTVARLQSSVSSFQVDDQSKQIADKVLSIYRKALEKVVSVQENSFKSIETYLSSVNSFLEEKSIEISLGESKTQRNPVGIKFEAGTPQVISGLHRALSSGERQIVTLIYAATHMSRQQIVLIDEPEISLHVDWQRHLLQKMSNQLGERQIIVCTHSPVIGADYEDRVVIFKPKITCDLENVNTNETTEGDSEDFL